MEYLITAVQLYVVGYVLLAPYYQAKRIRALEAQTHDLNRRLTVFECSEGGVLAKQHFLRNSNVVNASLNHCTKRIEELENNVRPWANQVSNLSLRLGNLEQKK